MQRSLFHYKDRNDILSMNDVESDFEQYFLCHHFSRFELRIFIYTKPKMVASK